MVTLATWRLTVMAAVPTTPPAWAETVAVPFPTAVTIPLASTVTTVGFVEDQTKLDTVEITDPPASKAAADKLRVSLSETKV